MILIELQSELANLDNSLYSPVNVTIPPQKNVNYDAFGSHVDRFTIVTIANLL